jgi:hypothetical protein
VLSHTIITREQYNGRDLANVRSLPNVMDRVEKESQKLEKEYAIDPDDHDQTNGGFLRLRHFCIDRNRRLKNRKQRVQNLIALISPP